MRLERHDGGLENVAAELALAVDELVHLERNRHRRVDVDLGFPEAVRQADIGKARRLNRVIARRQMLISRATDRPRPAAGQYLSGQSFWPGRGASRE